MGQKELNLNDDLEPIPDPKDQPEGPRWDRPRGILIYKFPDRCKAIFHHNKTDPRWEYRLTNGHTQGWYTTYDRLLIARQDLRVSRNQINQ